MERPDTYVAGNNIKILLKDYATDLPLIPEGIT